MIDYKPEHEVQMLDRDQTMQHTRVLINLVVDMSKNDEAQK
jgi:hypothetical protein